MCVACSCIQYTVYNCVVLSEVAALAPLRLGAWGQPGVSVAPSCVVSGGGADPVAAGCVGSARGECGPSCVVSGGGAGPIAAGCVGSARGECGPSCVVSGGSAGPVAAGCVGPARGECGPVLCCQWWRRWPRCGWVHGASPG